MDEVADVTDASPAESSVAALTAREPDPVLAGAVDIARAAAVDSARDEVRPGSVVEGMVDGVGEHLGVHSEAGVDGLIATHSFAAAVPGYTGWQWAVTVSRTDDSDSDTDNETDSVTVDEVVLLPGHDALLAPAWVPWEERVRPGDLAPGDLLPPRENDARLVPAYTLSGDPADDGDVTDGVETGDDDDDDEYENTAQVAAVAFELGLGRERVMSRDGRLFAAERWHAGDRGPDTAMARHAPAPCGTCGFFLPLAGALRAGFGVCGNDVTDTDGQVVSVEYGCGAHSQVVVEQPAADVAEIVYEDEVVEPI